MGTAQSGKTTVQYYLSDAKLIFKKNDEKLINSLIP